MNWRSAIHGSWFLAATGFPLSTLAAVPGETNDIPKLRPPHPEIPPTFLEQHGMQMVIAGLALLGFVALVVWLVTRPKPPIIVPPEVQARQALEALRSAPADGAALSRVSQILRRYIIAAFQLPPGEITTTEFCRALTNHSSIGPEFATAATEFLRNCDERKFAPTPPPPSAPGAVVQALTLVEMAEGRRAQLRATAPNPTA